MLNFFATWQRERKVIRELSRLSDRELADIGYGRTEIRSVARDSSRLQRVMNPSDGFSTLAPSWGNHLKRAVAR